MEIYTWTLKHWEGIGLVYLVTLRFLTAIQDAIDVEPKDLKPPLGRVIYYLQAVGGYVFAGNRVQPIQKTGV